MNEPFYPSETVHEGVEGISFHGINPRDSGFDPLDFVAVFGNDSPVVLEIGSGKGRFLLLSAASRPDFNLLGIEKSLHYSRVIVRRLRHAGLQNARMINHDAHLVLSRMIPDASIREVHIYFPDPWPRKREQKRRLIRDEVVRQLVRVMEPEAKGVWVTDHAEAYEAGVPVLRAAFDIEEIDPSVPREPRTNYEEKYREEGRPIYEVRFTPIRTGSGIHPWRS